MLRFDYFGALEDISQLMCRAVGTVCNQERSAKSYVLSQIRADADKKLYLIERALWSDFIPPLQRKDIASYAYSLSRVIERASDCYYNGKISLAFSVSNLRNEEGSICLELAERLADGTKLLRRLRRSAEMPSTEGFRGLLREGREAHVRVISKISTGALPKSYLRFAIDFGRLRQELGACYDKLMEVILNNI